MADASGILFGTKVQFEATNGGYNNISTIDAYRFLMSYRSGDDSLYGVARIGTISSGTIISLGSPYTCQPVSDTRHVANTVLSEDKMAVVFQTTGSGNLGSSRIGSISGTTISYGPFADTNDGGGVASPNVASLTDSKIVSIFRDLTDGSKGKAKIGTVGGLTVTYGSGYEYTADNDTYTDAIAVLDSNRFVIINRDATDSFYGKARIGTISGTTISFGPVATFYSDSSISHFNVISISSNTIVAANRDNTTGYSYCIAATVSGTSLVFGSGVSHNSGVSATWNRLCKIDDNRFTISYVDGGDSNHGTSKIGTIDGNSITFEANDGDEYFSDGFNDGVDCTILSPTLFAVMYKNKTGSDAGEVIAGTIPSVTYDMVGSGNLFTKGHLNFSVSGDLYTYGKTIDSGNTSLYIRGIVMAPVQTLDQTKSIDWLLRAPDHNPQIIGTFETLANVVTMQVWDSETTLVSLVNSSCYAIGNTGRWGWSTANLPSIRGNPRFYSYAMTSDAGEIFGGQFVLDVPERAKWIHPDNFEDFIV